MVLPPAGVTLSELKAELPMFLAEQWLAAGYAAFKPGTSQTSRYRRFRYAKAQLCPQFPQSHERVVNHGRYNQHVLVLRRGPWAPGMRGICNPSFLSVGFYPSSHRFACMAYYRRNCCLRQPRLGQGDYSGPVEVRDPCHPSEDKLRSSTYLIPIIWGVDITFIFVYFVVVVLILSPENIDKTKY